MRNLAFLMLPALFAHAGDAERKAAIRKGVAYLDEQLFALPDARGTPRKQFTVAVAGLVHLMKEPRTGVRSPIPRIKAYLLRYLDEVERRTKAGELPRRHGVASSEVLTQYTWPVAMAGMLFCELHLRGQHGKQPAAALRRIVAILEQAQQSNGGWGHGRVNPDRPEGKNPFGPQFAKLKGGYPSTLLSSSNVVAGTLGICAAILGRDEVPPVRKAREYYRAARLPNGSFPYDPSQRSSGFAKTNAGRTAGAVFAMHCLGMARDEGFERSAEYLLTNLPFVVEGHGSPCLNMMHGALACRALGPRIFKRFLAMYSDRLIAAQDEQGAFACVCEQKAFGVTCDSRQMLGGVFAEGQKVYVTALHTFVLLLGDNRLKIADKALPRATTTPR